MNTIPFESHDTLHLLQKHKVIFGNANVRIFKSPGRINLAGEHTDYNMGKVMPVAISYNLLLFISHSQSANSRAYTAHYDAAMTYNHSRLTSGKRHWGNYIIGITCLLQERLQIQLPPVDISIHGYLPTGAGLSSSAALTAGMAYAFNTMFDLKVPPVELAEICMEAEHRFANVKCGMLDPVACLMCTANNFLIFDCRDYAYHNIPVCMDDHSILLIDTGVRHNLAQSGHLNECFMDCKTVVQALQKEDSRIESLRDATLPALEGVKGIVTEKAFNRAKYIINEMARFETCVQAVAGNNFYTFGDSMYATHKELDELYDVSCGELNFIVNHCAESGVVSGAKMTGGGRGGCVIALVKKNKTEELKKDIVASFRIKFSAECSVLNIETDDGAHELFL